jgi:hypothetical protein
MSPFDGLALWLFFFTSVYLLILGWHVHHIKRTQHRMVAMQAATLALVTLASQGEKISEKQLLEAMNNVHKE